MKKVIIMWEKDKTEKYCWWNQDQKSSRVIDVWQYDKKSNKGWRATVNNSFLAKDVTKKEALNEAKKYMKKFR